jgi:hypothetical protein
MTFTQVFGGTTIYPSGVSYRAVALSANQTLAWPVETATSGNVVAQIMDVTPSAGSLSIIMPPANEVSVGETTLFFNPGAFTFTVKDNGGNTIVSIAPGLSYQVYLIGNSTVNGTWRSTQYAAGTSSATAGSLVGSGIKAINTTLNQSMSVTTLNSNYAIGDADRSEAFVWTGGAGAFTLPSSGTVGNDWFCQIRNGGSGAITLTPTGSELINGTSSLTFNPGDSAIVICDGSAFFTIGFGQSVAFAFDYVSIDLSSPVTSPYTLSGANLNRIAYSFGGTLTANMEVLIPATIQQYWISNETSGAFSLTVKVSGQIGVIVPQGARGIYYCNGTDIIDADTSSFAFPVTVAQGGTGATTESGARVNLGGTSVGIAVFTAATTADGRNALSAAKSGANSDITSLTGLTTPLSVGQGGTGTATAFTAGSVAFAGASGVYSQDNANFFWDDTTNRLGLGTNAPVDKISIVDETNAGFRLAEYNDTDGAVLRFATARGTIASPTALIADSVIFGLRGIGYTSAGSFASVATASINARAAENFTATAQGTYLQFSTTATGTTTLGERMRINAAGDVGIGTTAPTGKLDVNGKLVLTGGEDQQIQWTNNSQTWRLNNSTTGRFYLYDVTGNKYPFGVAANTPSDTLSLNGTGVGVGTTTPGSKLEVFGGTVGTTAGNEISIANNRALADTNSVQLLSRLIRASNGADWTTTTMRLQGRVDASNFGYIDFVSNNSQGLVFGSDATEMMRINASGNVGIGTTSPAGRLDVVSTSSGGASFMRIANGSGTANSYAAISFDPGNNGFNTRDAQIRAINNGSNQIDLTFLVSNALTPVEAMRIGSSGNVGIGTGASSDRLNVAGNIQATNATYGYLGITSGAVQGQFAANGSAGTVDVRAVSNHAMTLLTNNTERMRIDTSGNVGIGTASPNAKLDVIGVAAARSDVSTGNSPLVAGNVNTGNNTTKYTSLLFQGHDTVNTGKNTGLVMCGPSDQNYVTSYLAFHTRLGDVLAEKMRLTSDGNLGVGSSAPTAKLDVIGNAIFGRGGGTFQGATLVNSDDSAVSETVSFIDAQNNLSTADSHMFFRHQTDGGSSVSWATTPPGARNTDRRLERMRINPSGNLLVGTTSTSYAYADTSMRWQGSAGGILLSQNTTANVNQIAFFNPNGAVGAINTDGSGTIYGTSSDVRLKHDIIDAPEASNLIDAIQVRSFKWNADNSEQRYGMVAQELLEVAPEAVSQPADPDEMMAVDYSKLVPMLVKELQSLRARVAQLEGN